VESKTTQEFRERFAKLPAPVRKYSKRVYRRWQVDPWQPPLQFKPIHRTLPIYSVRIGLRWRAIGVRAADKVIWFWIGSHKEYDQKIKNLRRSR